MLCRRLRLPIGIAFPKEAHSLPRSQMKKNSRRARRLRLEAAGYQIIRPTPKPKPISPASNAFLTSYEWRKLRMEALIKYGRRCMCCGATPSTGAVMNVDHIKPRKRYPELALEINNLQILCHDCNHGKGNWNETDWRNE